MIKYTMYKDYIIEPREIFDKETGKKVLDCCSVKYRKRKRSKTIYDQLFMNVPQAREFIDDVLISKKYIPVYAEWTNRL